MGIDERDMGEGRTMFSVLCDRCGIYRRETAETFTVSIRVEEATIGARREGWMIDGSKAYCPQCREMMAKDAEEKVCPHVVTYDGDEMLCYEGCPAKDCREREFPPRTGRKEVMQTDRQKPGTMVDDRGRAYVFRHFRFGWISRHAGATMVARVDDWGKSRTARVAFSFCSPNEKNFCRRTGRHVALRNLSAGFWEDVDICYAEGDRFATGRRTFREVAFEALSVRRVVVQGGSDMLAANDRPVGIASPPWVKAELRSILDYMTYTAEKGRKEKDLYEASMCSMPGRYK